jgi:hypothetical protein
MPSEEVQPTLVKDDHKGPMPAVVSCFENNTLNHSEVCRTLTGNHDDRVTDTGTSVVHVGMAQNTRDEVRIVGGDNQTTLMGMSISSEVEPTMKAKSDGCGAVAIAREGAEGE